MRAIAYLSSFIVIISLVQRDNIYSTAPEVTAQTLQHVVGNNPQIPGRDRRSRVRQVCSDWLL